MSKQIIVVEGKNDVTRLKQVFPNINVVSVNGSAIDPKIVLMLKEKQSTHEIILCTDPDYPGLKIRSALEAELGTVSHVFIERKIAFSKNKKKIGLEHLNNNEIRDAFSNILKKQEENTNDINLEFLVNVGLIGNDNSKYLRNEVSKILNIGHVNGKTLLSRINNFNIDKDKIIETITLIENKA